MQEMAMGNKIEAEMYSKDSFKKDYFTCNTREGEKKITSWSDLIH